MVICFSVFLHQIMRYMHSTNGYIYIYIELYTFNPDTELCSAADRLYLPSWTVKIWYLLARLKFGCTQCMCLDMSKC